MELASFFYVASANSLFTTLYTNSEQVGRSIGNFKTDRQSHKFFYTIYLGAKIFLSVSFPTSVLALLAGELHPKRMWYLDRSILMKLFQFISILMKFISKKIKHIDLFR